MNIILEGTKFSIKSENINNMLMSFKKTYPNDEDINSIEEVFRKFGYYIHMGKEGNITDIEAAEETLPNDQEGFFAAIAEYVVNGSYIILRTGKTQTKFVFENGKVQELEGEIVFCDKNLKYDNVIAILDYILEYACELHKVREVIGFLMDGGVTEDELISLCFDKSDIERLKEDMEDEWEKSI